jgi:hypothetical protein
MSVSIKPFERKLCPISIKLAIALLGKFSRLYSILTMTAAVVAPLPVPVFVDLVLLGLPLWKLASS